MNSSKNKIFQFTEYFRPRALQDIIGQKVPTGTLLDHLRRGEYQTGYLFLGPAGVGKTSTAYILSLAANCRKPVQPGEPCGRCQSCLEPEGDHPDIFIINATTLNKAADVEAIIKEVKNHHIEHKVLCVIMDEWHNLTKAAREKLLEILEAAKMKASEKMGTDYLFILPTTSIETMQPALLTRLTPLHFKPLSKKVMKEHLEYVCEEVGLEPEDEALDMIYKSSKGSARKALKLLEDIRDYSSSQDEQDRLLVKYTEEVLQSASSIIAEDVFEAILNLNVFEANRIIKEHSEENCIIENDFNDLYTLMNDFISERHCSLRVNLIPILDHIIEQRIKAQTSPSNDDFLRLSNCVSFTISTIENVLYDTLGNEISKLDTDYWNLVRMLKPSFKYDLDIKKFLLVVDEPEDDLDLDFLDEDVPPVEFFEGGMESDFINTLFDSLDIDSYEYR